MKLPVIAFLMGVGLIGGSLHGEGDAKIAQALESLEQAEEALVQTAVLRGYLISGSRSGTSQGWSKNGELVNKALKDLRQLVPNYEQTGGTLAVMAQFYDLLAEFFQESPSSNQGFNQGILMADTLVGEWRREKAKAEGELRALFLEQPVAVLREMAQLSAQGTFSAADREVMDFKYQAMSISWSRFTGKEKLSGNILTPESAALEADWWAAQK